MSSRRAASVSGIGSSNCVIAPMPLSATPREEGQNCPQMSKGSKQKSALAPVRRSTDFPGLWRRVGQGTAPRYGGGGPIYCCLALFRQSDNGCPGYGAGRATYSAPTAARGQPSYEKITETII